MREGTEITEAAEFRQLVERHQASVLRLVSSILGPFRDIDAEDVAQDVFLRAYDKLSQFRGEAKFSTWLYRIAYTVALNRRRLARIRLPHVALEALADAVADENPHDAAVAAERASRLAAALEALPDLYRTVIYLHYWQDSSVEEIASLIGAPANTVKSYLYRGRARLAEFLKTEGRNA